MDPKGSTNPGAEHVKAFATPHATAATPEPLTFLRQVFDVGEYS